MGNIKDCLSVKALYRKPECSAASSYLFGFEYPWEALDGLKDWILSYGKTLSPDEYDHPAEDVWISKKATVAPTAYIHGPCVIGENTEVRHCAYIRGSALVGKGCVVGNSVELKNCILFDSVHVPHFNYVGDSVLGYGAHLGAGAVTSNIKSDQTSVSIRVESEKIDTGRRKFGAMLGDFVEVGCNSVLNPGAVVGVHTSIYPTSSVRGYVPEESIFKSSGCIVRKQLK